jgi:hypothetical protein
VKIKRLLKFFQNNLAVAEVVEATETQIMTQIKTDKNENKHLVSKTENAANVIRTNVIRINSNVSRTSRRRHHRSSSKGSYKIASSEIQMTEGQRSRSKSRSRKSLIEKDINELKSKSRHETSMDENNENDSERKRQIRRRKGVNVPEARINYLTK